ncbi:MAG: GFA family protein [Steroidobacteraceae bacterium]
MNQGSCLCGAVSYEAAGPFDMMAHCHCSMCRKHHGAMFATFLCASLAGFRWTCSEEMVVVYESSEQGHRPFCKRCGSVVPMIMQGKDFVFLLAGNLDGDPGIRPQMHIFTGSRASWYSITDALPQHAAYPPRFGGGEEVVRPVPMLKPGVTQGSCLCDAIAWELADSPERVHNCHCSRCRRARSAAHATNAFYHHEQLTWIRGEENIESYALEGAKRFGQDFCRHCGSPVPRVVASTGYVVVPCGGLDSAPAKGPGDHIFAGSKAPWFEITDSLPQWETLPART